MNKNKNSVTIKLKEIYNVYSKEKSYFSKY